MLLIKPDLDPADPLLDFDEHMRRFADGTLDASTLTKGYDRAELSKAARQLEASIQQGTYKSPTRLPGASIASGQLPWSRETNAALA